jgi:hypothetical protein
VYATRTCDNFAIYLVICAFFIGGPFGRPMMLPPHPFGGRGPVLVQIGGGRAILLPPNVVPVRRRQITSSSSSRRQITSSSSSSSSTTKKRIGKITLYHVTSLDSGRKIKRCGKMLRGSSGWFGGGIYFASSVSSCLRKTRNGDSCVIKAVVDMGTALVINASSNSTKYSYSKLQSMGCNSVLARGINTGDEYVVFNYSQVKILSVKDRHGNDV